ncbi:uncharacterized protein [Primulina huaijiensis]|uniref:uncharacterized protein n=1 Tax=Primulina huaijiensis TaxID=1492673 RepID=UPI003CC7934D
MGLMNTLTLSVKMFTISVGIVLLAVGMKSAVPIALNGFPIILSWWKPPFLYLIINCIIITIAASSRFFDQNHLQTSNVLSEQLVSSVKDSLPQDLAVLSLQSEINPAAVVVYDQREESHDELKSVTVNGSKVGSETEREDGIAETEGQEAFADSKPAHNNASAEIISTELQLEYPLRVTEKPLVSSRFVHRKPVRSSNAEGASALRVARLKRQETVENTWRMITEGCHMPLTRHQNHHKKLDPPKSDTFKNRAKFDPSSYRIRREPSLSRDELNCRVEAFIKKCNQDMRLQRQQSLQQYMEMIRRGA